MEDSRRAFVLAIIASACGSRDGSHDAQHLEQEVVDHAAVTDFLDNPSTRILQAVRHEDGSIHVHGSLEVTSVPEGAVEIHLVKLCSDVIRSDRAAQDVLIASLGGSPLQSLYYSLHEVYAPALLQGGQWSSQLDEETRALLSRLDSGLGRALRHTDGPGDEGVILGIQSVHDEFSYWNDLVQRGGADRQRAQTFARVLEPIAARWVSLDRQPPTQSDEPDGSAATEATSASGAEVLELIEDTKNALDDVWRTEVPGGGGLFPQPRMAHLLRIVRTSLAKWAHGCLVGGSSDTKQEANQFLWRGPFQRVERVLSSVQEALRAWQQHCESLTTTFWPNAPEHPWKGGPLRDATFAAFCRRVKDIQRLRTTHHDLARLLVGDERAHHDAAVFSEGDPLAPFEKVDALNIGPFAAPAWEAAISEFERRVKPAEEAAADRLREQLRAGDANPLAVLRQMAPFKSLLERDVVASRLQPERESLLAQLQAQIDTLSGALDARMSSDPMMHDSVDGHAGVEAGGDGPTPTGRWMTPLVDAITWAQTLRSKVARVLQQAASFLRSLPGFADARALAQEVASRANAWQKQLAQEWARRTEEALQVGELRVSFEGRLVQFDAEGNMRVNYSEDLVHLLRTTRQLAEVGLRIPNSVQRAASEAEKYFRFGVMLKKVAAFYNTMGSQIIPSQKPLLLSPLAEFESAVQGSSRASSGGSDVQWGNPAEVAAYVDTLQRAAERVASENRKLRTAHARLTEDVSRLMHLDLLRQKDTWKRQWNTTKEFVQQLMHGGEYAPDQMRPWLLHWDFQLYKALEAGYRMGLESLNENLPEVRCELTFAQRQIQFRPSVEELRAHYYRELKKFLALPTQFTGFGNKHVYRRMTERNAPSLVQVYRKAEILFARMGKVREKHLPLVILGRVSDLDAFVEEHVQSLEAWEHNLGVIRKKRRELDRLDDVARVDCVRISLAPLKSAVADQLRQLNRALLRSLRHSLEGKLTEVEEYLQQGMERLNERPQSIDEIGEAHQHWQSLQEKKRSMMEQTRSLDSEKQLFVSVVGSANVDDGGIEGGGGSAVEVGDEVISRIAALPDAWENFDIAMQAFHDMIAEQQEELKANVETDIVEVNRKVEGFASRWKALKPGQSVGESKSWSEGELEGIFESLGEWKQQLEELQSSANDVRRNCEAFGLPTPSFQGLTDLEHDVQETVQTWDRVRDYVNEKQEFAKQDWISFRARVFDLGDFAAKWAEAARGQVRDAAFAYISDECAAIKRALPALKFARGEPFKDEHWQLVFKKLRIPRGMRLEHLRVEHFLEPAPLEALGRPETAVFLKDLHARAQGEETIREALQEFRAWSETVEFSILEHESAVNKRRTPLIKDWRDLFTEVGDNQSLLQSLKDSPYYSSFEGMAREYESKLAMLDTCIHDLNTIQRRWVYLEPIFGRGALPAEQPRFRRVDDEFRDIMSRIEQDPKVFTLTEEALFPALQSRLQSMVDQLERCQKALSDFLEVKRSAMPRFYFLGDDDLLEILGQAQTPQIIQAHLKKLFQGIHRVEFSEDHSQITAILSLANERVPLEDHVAVTEQVETWLNVLNASMVATLARLVADAVRSRSRGEPLDLSSLPSQVLSLVEAIRFSTDVDNALRQRDPSAALDVVQETLRSQLEGYTSLDIAGDQLLGLKVKALVLDVVHHMDVVDQLKAAGADRPSHWAWHRQLKFKLPTEPSSDAIAARTGALAAVPQDVPIVEVHMVDAVMPYTYEYQGNGAKLVHTPLTDKCYLTLTQGMAMGYGGNPYGPAGTGKTESVKALGAALGRQVLVFNCDEGIDFQSMGRIFTGLVKCGAWGCFDEFNRLKEDQLSAVSQQIQVIQAAIKERSPTLFLLGANLDVDHNAGIFVTMNPAGKGYGGRSKLPDNLKQLFRPVAMSKPDNELIAEVILFSEGFAEAKELAAKMVSLFTLSEQLLSSQQHYDWGLRAMKTCLNTGGDLINAAKQRGEEISAERECTILIQAVRVNTLSKLTFSDTQRFLALMGDVFPGVPSNDVANEELESAIRTVMTEAPFHLQVDSGQVRKMLQLKEALDQRMGCVIVGPSGCGKSTLWRVLQSAMERCGHSMRVYVMNPKSMSRSRLLGHMDPDTREWTDGVLTAAARSVVKEPTEVNSWIVCDGDVDPEWVESLNSVLDDNHLLTLPNGERISFGPNVNFLFETHDLRHASPATISRLGMVYLSDDDVEVHRITDCWIQRQPEEQQESLRAWMDELFFRALEWVLREGQGAAAPAASRGDGSESQGRRRRSVDGGNGDSARFVVETTMVGTVQSGLSQLGGAKTRAAFAVGLVRGLGGNFSEAKRSQFARDVFSWAREAPPDPSAPLDCIVGPTGDLQPIQPTSVATEAAELEVTALSEGTPIPTVSLQRHAALIRAWMDSMEPFVLVGPQGSGKSMVLRYALAQRKGTSLTTLHCNAQTTAEHVVQKLRQTCALYATNKGRVFRPKEGDRLVLFLKDVNLPKPDMWGTCPLIAFLQQLLTFRGFYDSSLEFLGLDRVHIVCSMTPASTLGRHPLSTRFTAIVRIAAIDYPDGRELGTILGAYLTAAMQPSSGSEGRSFADDRLNSAAGIDALASSLVEVYDKVRTTFTVDEQRHYLFTPRDLIRWICGLLRYDLCAANPIEVVAHEGRRIFRDRIVTSEERHRFDTILVSVLRSRWQHTPSTEPLVFTSLSEAARASAIAGSDDEGGKTKQALLQEMAGRPMAALDLEDFRGLVERGMVLFEREERALGVCSFRQMLEHVAIVDRALSASGGSVLLVGRPGVGRRSTAALAAHMHGMQWFSPAVTRSFGVKAFVPLLKQAISAAGGQGEDVVLFMEDHHFDDPGVLELLNSLLSAGEVPGLFASDEMDTLLSPLQEELGRMSAFRFRSAMDLFRYRVAQQLHVCVAMDPEHPSFRVRTEANPALFGHCQVVWMGTWSRSSLRELPPLYLPKLLGDGEDADEHGVSTNAKEAETRAALAAWIAESGDTTELIDVLASIHEWAAEAGLQATPREYVALLRTYEALFYEKGGEVHLERDHLAGGLRKLQEAQDMVDKLSRDANEQRSSLQEKQAAADEAMRAITSALSEASDRRREVEALQEQSAKAEEATASQKAQIEEQLSDVRPQMEAARRAVGQIKKRNLDEIRHLRAPPEPVADVLSAVLRLLGNDDTSWMSMRRFLGGSGVVDDILSYNPERITPALRAQIGRIVEAKANSFEANVIKRASQAAAPMAAWVKANLNYSKVLEQIEPLNRQLDDANEKLSAAQEQLSENERELETIDHRVAKLKDDFSHRTAEAEQLKMALRQTESTLQRAETLLGKLAGEKDRWATTVGELEATLRSFPRRILVAAAFVTFLGGSTEDTREEAVKAWCGLAGIETKNALDIRYLLSSESEMLRWKSHGLPGDALSMENAVVILHGHLTGRWPFVADHGGSALSWLERQLTDDGRAGSSSSAAGRGPAVDVLSAADPRFQTQIELAVRFGKTLLLRDSEGIEPFLFPLLRRDILQQGPRQMIAVGEKVVDYNDSFRLFMFTQDPGTKLSPDAGSLVTSVNFTVTRSGLEGQLLSVTLQHERPELETRKTELLQEEETLKVQLSDLERNLVETLAAASGNILENDELMEQLTATKTKSADVQVSLDGSAATSEELDAQREVYRPFAHAGSHLFFLLRGLRVTNTMYEFSLAWYLDLFRATLRDPRADTGGSSNDVALRIKSLRPVLEETVLEHVGRSLLKEDRLMFALHLVRGMHPHLFQEQEWDFFVGDLAPDVSGGDSTRLPAWAPPDRAPWLRLLEHTFPRLAQTLQLQDAGRWQGWGQSAEAERAFPSSVGQSLSAWQKVLVVQTLRPDRLLSALHLFVQDALGVSSISPREVSFHVLQEESSAMQPVLMISTVGADPTRDLHDFAGKTIGREAYHELAMGGGQQDGALRTLRQAAGDGHWLCLKNLHLVVAWLPTLQKELGALDPHPDFRLWLTSECHPEFPAVLLQKSLKVTFEAPPGLKRNLQRTYESWDADFLAQGPSPALRAQLFFLLAWFHGVVQERRTYVPQGWTKAYEFSSADLRAGVTTVDALLSRSKATSANDFPWKTFRGLMVGALYGGRVDNVFDARILQVFLRKCFHPELLQSPHAASSLARGLTIPSSTRPEDFERVIESLPETDPPYVFGLPENIDRSVQRAASGAVVTALKNLSVHADASAGFDRARWRSRLSPLVELWEKLTSSQSGSIFQADPASSSSQADSPLHDFVALELRLSYSLVTMVHSHMNALKRVLYGSGLLSPLLQEMGETLLADGVPSSWTRRWEGPDNVRAWLRAVVRRRIALLRWASAIGDGVLLQSPLCLADLLRPRTFLNALRQQTARETGTSIDQLKLDNAWDASQLQGAGSSSVQLSGLLFQGASFSRGVLQPASASAPELVEAPTCSVAWVPRTQAPPYREGERVAVPVYVAPNRERLLTELEVPLPRGEDPDTWTLAGLALFLAGDE